MLNTDLLMASELWALASGDEFKAAVGLWCRAWKQTPPGSLPDDDRVLAAFSGAGKAWPKVKGMALRGFVKCSDGRLYHSTLCDDVVRASKWKAESEAGKAGAADRKRKEREKRSRLFAELKSRGVTPAFNVPTAELRTLITQYVTPPVTPPVTVTVTAIQRQDRTGQEREDDGIGSAGANRPHTDVSRETEKPQPDQLALLETKLREAAGWQNEPAPMLAVTGQIQALIDAGAVLETDVLPTVRALAPQCRGRTSWKYFLNAIAQSRDDRISASTLVSQPRQPGHSDAKPERRGNIAAMLAD